MPSYRLVHPSAARAAAPVLDSFQQSVVDHEAGPLLVLAGPGTGKTTTLVEAIVDRIEQRGASPDSVLALTFSRKAAEQLRDRVTARIGRTMSTTLSSTFHSFAYGVVRAHSTPDLYAAPLRLLSAPEQDVMLEEMLEGTRDDTRFWPESLRHAVGTRGFAREVQAVLARAREKGLDPLDLKEIALSSQVPELLAAARFMQQYQVILDDHSAIDYSELIYRVVQLAEQPAVRNRLREQFQHIFVDEYQDTDPAQVRLLQSIAGDGRNLVVVGDPDQSIYAFRGAEVRGILDFPDQFHTRTGERAPTVALRVTRRFGPVLLEASRAVAGSIPSKGAIEANLFHAFRNPQATETPFGPGAVDVRTFDTQRAETEHIADLLRRAHLEDAVPWSQMAVLVRSGRGSIPALRRSLSAAGVPVEVASDDTPLVGEPAVNALLGALDVVVNLHNNNRGDRGYVGVDRVESLLASPLAGLDATEVRALARTLRGREKAVAAGERAPRQSPELLREALLKPKVLHQVPGRPAAKVAHLGALLQDARTHLEAGATTEEVLWTLWSGTRWPQRLRAMVNEGGAAARMAHRDLDALCALFDTAARTEEQRGHTSVVNFLSTLTAQRIPADTLAEQGVRGEGVRLLTAHRSKGLEWRFVVVAQVQEGAWPDLRRRSMLLHADRIGGEDMLPPVTTASLLAEERRLFYVACTRASERLLVTAVRSAEEDGDQPSRFLDELGPEPVPVKGRPTRPLSLAGLVAELRRTASDDAVSPALRRAAAHRLARLALVEANGRQLVPQADPAHWWGTRGRSFCQQPIRSADEPVRLSASMLEAILTCPAKWFLEREAGGADASTAAQGFGTVVHALADRIAKGDISDTDDLMAHVDRVWGQISFRAPWSSSRERKEMEAALSRFVAWHSRPGARTVVATEQHLLAEVTLPDGSRVRLNGYADRLELDEDGRVVVVDLKTSKYPPTDKDLPTNAQLGLYQHAVNNGALDELLADHPDRPPGPVRAGGAELVQLRKEVRGGAKVQAQQVQQPDEDGHLPIEKQLMEAVRVVRGEHFPARAGAHCDHCSFHAICPVKGAGTVLS